MILTYLLCAEALRRDIFETHIDSAPDRTQAQAR